MAVSRSQLAQLASTAALIAVVGVLGLVSVSRHNVRPVALEDEDSGAYVTETPSRVPEIKKYGMGFNDRLGIKPLCTHITNKAGLVDCVSPDDIESATGGSGDGHCDDVCFSCAGGVMAGPTCDSCLCGVNSDYYAAGVAPDDCKQVCYFCRTAMTSGSVCRSCSCGLWPAPLTQDPLDNQLLF
mmetsp:Transcript_12157/g.24234  ORF Transcript_12157/g.24234 Transcript_12157/m.24234 type:complete len:184 (-) Transcript_12157:233-784(-)